MDVHLRSALHPLLGRLRIGAPRLWPLSPKLHTSDYSFACPGSSTWVDKVPSRDTPSLNLADYRGGVVPDNPQVALRHAASRSVASPPARLGAYQRQRPAKLAKAELGPAPVLVSAIKRWARSKLRRGSHRVAWPPSQEMVSSGGLADVAHPTDREAAWPVPSRRRGRRPCPRHGPPPCPAARSAVARAGFVADADACWPRLISVPGVPFRCGREDGMRGPRRRHSNLDGQRSLWRIRRMPSQTTPSMTGTP